MQLTLPSPKSKPNILVTHLGQGFTKNSDEKIIQCYEDLQCQSNFNNYSNNNLAQNGKNKNGGEYLSLCGLQNTSENFKHNLQLFGDRKIGDTSSEQKMFKNMHENYKNQSSSKQQEKQRMTKHPQSQVDKIKARSKTQNAYENSKINSKIGQDKKNNNVENILKIKQMVSQKNKGKIEFQVGFSSTCEFKQRQKDQNYQQQQSKQKTGATKIGKTSNTQGQPFGQHKFKITKQLHKKIYVFRTNNNDYEDKPHTIKLRNSINYIPTIKFRKEKQPNSLNINANMNDSNILNTKIVNDGYPELIFMQALSPPQGPKVEYIISQCQDFTAYIGHLNFQNEYFIICKIQLDQAITIVKFVEHTGFNGSYGPNGYQYTYNQIATPNNNQLIHNNCYQKKKQDVIMGSKHQKKELSHYTQQRCYKLLIGLKNGALHIVDSQLFSISYLSNYIGLQKQIQLKKSTQNQGELDIKKQKQKITTKKEKESTKPLPKVQKNKIVSAILSKMATSNVQRKQVQYRNIYIQLPSHYTINTTNIESQTQISFIMKDIQNENILYLVLNNKVIKKYAYSCCKKRLDMCQQNTEEVSKDYQEQIPLGTKYWLQKADLDRLAAYQGKREKKDIIKYIYYYKYLQLDKQTQIKSTNSIKILKYINLNQEFHKQYKSIINKKKKKRRPIIPINILDELDMQSNNKNLNQRQDTNYLNRKVDYLLNQTNTDQSFDIMHHINNKKKQKLDHGQSQRTCLIVLIQGMFMPCILDKQQIKLWFPNRLDILVKRFNRIWAKYHTYDMHVMDDFNQNDKNNHRKKKQINLDKSIKFCKYGKRQHSQYSDSVVDQNSLEENQNDEVQQVNTKQQKNRQINKQISLNKEDQYEQDIQTQYCEQKIQNIQTVEYNEQYNQLVIGCSYGSIYLCSIFSSKQLIGDLEKSACHCGCDDSSSGDQYDYTDDRVYAFNFFVEREYGFKEGNKFISLTTLQDQPYSCICTDTKILFLDLLSRKKFSDTLRQKQGRFINYVKWTANQNLIMCSVQRGIQGRIYLFSKELPIRKK